MPLNKYRVFYRIAQTGNMRKAAEEMKYTQQAVSRIVKCLEKNWGFALFKRERDGVSLTAEAEKLLPYINQLIKSEDDLINAVSTIQVDEGLAKNVHVGACGSIVMGLMHKVLDNLAESHPDLAVGVLYDANNDTTIEDLKNGRIDCALMVEGCQGDMDFELLFKENFVAVVPEKHPLAEKESISIEEMINYPNVITLDNPYYDEILSNCKHNTAVVDEEIMMLPIIARGKAVGIMTGSFNDSYYKNIVVKPLDKPRHRGIGIATRPEDELSEDTKLLIDTLKEIVNREYNA